MGMIAAGTLAGLRATHARAQIPAWGCWFADVALDGEHTLSGQADLVIADLTLKGTVLDGGPTSGRSYYRIVGGKGGWGKIIEPIGEANDLGVKLSTVLTKVARLAGEDLDLTTVPSTRLGPACVLVEGPASRLLELRASKAWYVGEDGVTRLGTRAAAALAEALSDGPVDHARGTVTLARESIAAILPGVTVRGLTAIDVHHEVDAKGGLRTTIWGQLAPTDASRRLDAWRALFDALDPARPYRGVTEYRVLGLEGKRANLTPVRASSGMPDLKRVMAYPGVPGCEGSVRAGSVVLVGFINSDHARPYICGFEHPEGPGFVPTSITLTGSSFVDVGGEGAATLAKSAGTQTALNTLGTWVAACTAALAANPAYTSFQAAMVAPGSAAATALAAAVARIPTSKARGK